FIRKSLSSPLYVVVRFFLLFSHQSISLIHNHPSFESVAKLFLNPNQPLNETTHAHLEAYHKEKQGDSYLTVSLYRSISGFINRLI
ncbi:hypothetical protein Gohar_026882, partial [Gossypium harknessii]|nr:hypothetical protein [Gossypium harknessii]